MSQAGTSSQAYAQFDNHNGDGSRASFPLDVDDADTYGLSAALVKGPNFGIVQLFVDGRQIGGTYDLYSAAVTVPPPVALGPLALSEGKHILTMKVIGKNDASTDFLGGIDLLVLDSQAAPQPTPTAVATAEVGAQVPATLALTRGAGRVRRLHARRGEGVHGDHDGQRGLHRRRRRADGLRPRQAGQRHPHAAPSRCRWPSRRTPGATRSPTPPSTIAFKQAIEADEPLRTGSYTKTLTFTLSTTNP